VTTPWQVLQGIQRMPLGLYPTPLHPLTKLSVDLQTELWMKRDDLISFALGGNKIRGLEFLVADALEQKADTLVTGAGAQSNHVRATAAAAKTNQLDCTAVFWGTPPDQIDGNLRLTKMYGADLVFTMDGERASVDAALKKAAAGLQIHRKHPYIIPRGGACAIGALGHVMAVYEVFQQCQDAAFYPDTVVMAIGSGGTYAGWKVGLAALNLSWKILAVSVSRPSQEASQQVARLANETAGILGLPQRFEAKDCPVLDQHIGAGYGIPSIEGAQAIRTVGHCEGLLLDPTYTGKAMAGLMHALDTGLITTNQRLLFLHTGGEPAFFSGDGHWLDV